MRDFFIKAKSIVQPLFFVLVFFAILSGIALDVLGIPFFWTFSALVLVALVFKAIDKNSRNNNVECN